MKQFLILCLLLPAMAFRTGSEPLAIGSAMPKGDIVMRDVSGKDISLNKARKQNGLLVMFSCNTCPVVLNNAARANDIAKFALENKVGVIFLNSNAAEREVYESMDAMKAYAAKEKFSWYYALDEKNELADAFGATKTPECFLFDNSGKLVYHGAIDDNPNKAEAVTRKHLQLAITEVSNGKDVTVKTSRSVGCSIKRAG
ncbi:thioredoxin family protein [Pseudoflavitalea sp. G-6-1-2]|uniref:thioredoxin family protein n=1 Tax=Pseudoflavitalea sp. G-6-1-2 TaxID=2728841 RepID=UPI00146E13B5|nr:thioredoxin family protein [Pseudoflavitalea sp. G-6-1-2]NML23650.1 thioredoxin family protein [Pseudoflavitalea sp. G-6-1-2]